MERSFRDPDLLHPSLVPSCSIGVVVRVVGEALLVAEWMQVMALEVSTLQSTSLPRRPRQISTSVLLVEFLHILFHPSMVKCNGPTSNKLTSTSEIGGS